MKTLSKVLLIGSAIHLLACSNPVEFQSNDQLLFSSEIKKFSSCNHLSKTVKAASELLFRLEPYIQVDSSTIDNQRNTRNNSVSSGNKHFILFKNSIEVFDRSTLQRIKILPIAPVDAGTLLANNQHVILLTESYLSGKDGVTTISLFNTDRMSLENQIKVAGSFIKAEIIDDQLILQTQSKAVLKSLEGRSFNPDPTILSPNCDDIYEAQTNAYSNLFTLIYSFNLNKDFQYPTITGFAGSADKVHITKSTMYLHSSHYYKVPSYIRQLRWDSNAIYLNSFASFPGALNQLAGGIQEYKDQSGTKIAFVTTIFDSYDNHENQAVTFLPDTSIAHRILVFSDLGSKLKLTAESELFGIGSYLKSVQFLSDLAYVVTPNSNAPVSIFDMSDRSNIRKINTLNIPDFPSHVRALFNSYLFGVTEISSSNPTTNTQKFQVQISLFDAYAKENPIPKTLIRIGMNGSTSDATSDPSALTYDESTGILAFPILEWGSVNSNPPYEPTINFVGAEIYKYRQGQIYSALRISHNKWRKQFFCDSSLSPAYIDINRIIMFDGKLVTISKFGIMAHDPQTLGLISEQIAAPGPNGYCH